MNLKFIRIASVMTLASGVTALAAGDGWTELFNGQDLSGWIQRGGKAKYTVAEGCIVGSTVLGTDNSFLCTEEDYGDFILELDFKDNPMLNSGVQFRSHCFTQSTTIQNGAKEIKVPAGRVHGYQCEIDMDPVKKRWWTAGIYDEARRGWLYPADGEPGKVGQEFTAQGAKVSQAGEWNHLRIEAIGSSVKTWLNGEPRATINDSMTPSGLIGLQVHGIGKDVTKEGIKVSFKNLRLQTVNPAAAANTLTAEEKAAGWKLLWDGQTSDGWRSAKSDKFPAQGWEIKDGVLSVLASGGAESAAGGDIITRDRYANFELTADFKITPGANSGIKYFVQPNLGAVTGAGAKANTGSALGPEFQVLDDALHPDAKLGRNGNRTLASLYDLIPAATNKPVAPMGDWNHARIISRGQHVEHWLNGQKVLEYERGSPEFRAVVAQSKFKNIPGFGEWPDGHLLLQDHGNSVSYRNLKLRVLPTE